MGMFIFMFMFIACLLHEHDCGHGHGHGHGHDHGHTHFPRPPSVSVQEKTITDKRNKTINKILIILDENSGAWVTLKTGLIYGDKFFPRGRGLKNRNFTN
jgi:hypothetical protein